MLVWQSSFPCRFQALVAAGAGVGNWHCWCWQLVLLAVTAWQLIFKTFLHDESKASAADQVTECSSGGCTLSSLFSLFMAGGSGGLCLLLLELVLGAFSSVAAVELGEDGFELARS